MGRNASLLSAGRTLAKGAAGAPASAIQAYLKAVGALREDVNSARAHYQSPVQMLAREGLGSERRSRLLHQIEKSGQIELASLEKIVVVQIA